MGPRIAPAGWLLVTLLLIANTTGCSTRGEDTDRTTGTTEPANLAKVVSEATAFGGIHLGADDIVVDARAEGALDSRYQLTIETDPAGVPALLGHSRFDATLIADSPPFDNVIAGPDLASSPAVFKAQDRFVNPDKKQVTRNIVVDERDDQTRFVHIELFTT